MQTYGKYFDDTPEPDSWLDNFKKLYSNHHSGTDYKIRPLDYFYDQEKNSKKMVQRLEDVYYFIQNDPYNKGASIVDLDEKMKISRVIRVNHVEGKKPKKKKDKKVKHKEPVRKVTVRRLED